MTAAYGWTFDHTVSVLILLPIAVSMLKDDWQRRRLAKIAVLVVYLIIDAVALFSNMEQSWYWWMAPVMLGWYLVARGVFVETGGCALSEGI
jgi:K+ transporter